MRNLAKVLTILVLSMGILSIPDFAAGNGADAFEKLKALVGHWETDKTNVNKATLDLELTSGGTALLEKFHMVENGKPVEMTTITFDLVSISNLKSADDGHMHHAVYTFIDNDHFKTTWTFRKEQKDTFTEDVTYIRTK